MWDVRGSGIWRECVGCERRRHLEGVVWGVRGGVETVVVIP